MREQYGVNNFRHEEGGPVPNSPASATSNGGRSAHAQLAKIKSSKKKQDQDFVVDLLSAANTSSSVVITELRDINSIRFVDPSKWWPKFDGLTQRVSSQMLSNGGNGAPGG